MTCWARGNFIDLVKHCLLQILNILSPLINPANWIHKDTVFQYWRVGLSVTRKSICRSSAQMSATQTHIFYTINHSLSPYCFHFHAFLLNDSWNVLTWCIRDTSLSANNTCCFLNLSNKYLTLTKDKYLYHVRMCMDALRIDEAYHILITTHFHLH